MDLRKKYLGDLTLVGDVCIDIPQVCESKHCIYIMTWIVTLWDYSMGRVTMY